MILDLNLITANPQLAGAWAREAERGFPRGSIVGFEVGNEPDIYDRRFWLEHTDPASGLLPRAVTARSYARDFHAYAQTLAGRRTADHAQAASAIQRNARWLFAAVHAPSPAQASEARIRRAVVRAGDVPLLGPALSGPRRHHKWITTLLHGPHPQLGAISVHQYPFTVCVSPTAHSFATLRRVLSPRATAGMASALAPALHIARRVGLPVLVTEFNSVTCGGRRGVSNAFATALWSPDALLTLARAGVRAAFLHVRAFSYNTPFELTGHGARVRPLLYGLILFRRTLGPDARLANLRRSPNTPAALATWAVQNRRSLRVLLINKRARAALVRLKVPAHGIAHLQRLTAPSAAATSRVTLAGQWLDRRLRWRGRRVTTSVAAHHDIYRVRVPGFSAALLDLATAPSRAAAPPPHTTLRLASVATRTKPWIARR